MTQPSAGGLFDVRWDNWRLALLAAVVRDVDEIVLLGPQADPGMNMLARPQGFHLLLDDATARAVKDDLELAGASG